MNNPQRLLASLQNQTPTPEQIVRIERLRQKARELALSISAECSDSREKSLACTHLEETVMWAVKSIVLEDI